MNSTVGSNTSMLISRKLERAFYLIYFHVIVFSFLVYSEKQISHLDKPEMERWK